MMLDCYGSTESKLDDVKYINNMLNHIAYEVGVITVAPPFLLPYYYGVDQSDMGVSAFCSLKAATLPFTPSRFGNAISSIWSMTANTM